VLLTKRALPSGSTHLISCGFRRSNRRSEPLRRQRKRPTRIQVAAGVEVNGADPTVRTARVISAPDGAGYGSNEIVGRPAAKYARRRFPTQRRLLAGVIGDNGPPIGATVHPLQRSTKGSSGRAVGTSLGAACDVLQSSGGAKFWWHAAYRD
jgi:hypothetical protein